MSQPEQAQILVVDDTPQNLRLLVEILSAQGYVIRPAISGKVALKSIATTAPDLILMDVRMPEMDGYEACRQIKKNELYSNIPVIFISALDDIADKIKGFKAGGVDFITKPFQEEEVLARVKTHLTLWFLQRQMAEKNTQLQLEISERKRVESALLNAYAELAMLNQKLDYLSRIDLLTGLSNRRDFQEKFEIERARALRNKTTFGMIMGDIDHFKKINDSKGHECGDAVLKQLGEILRSQMRPGDTVARYGGEEFVIVLSDTGLFDATVVAERIRSIVEHNDFIYGTEKICANISFGVCAFSGSHDFSYCIKAVDRCLYEAKNIGRNKTVSCCDLKLNQ